MPIDYVRLPSGYRAGEKPTDRKALSVATRFTYDAAGDVTADGIYTYQYDAEGRLATVDSGSTESYIYNALGQEVRFTTPNYTWDHVYDAAGSWIGRYSNGGWPVSGVFHLGGRPFAIYLDQAYFVHVNALGSTAMTSSAAGGVAGDTVFYPWGQYWLGGGPEGHYAAFEYNDSATGLDPTLFRQYPPEQSRWLTPDPAGLGAANPANPQTWNRYAYVTNNPVSLIDPMGLGDCGGDTSFDCNGPPPPPNHGGGGGGGGVPGGSTTCYLDNVEESCSAASAQQQGGAAVQCPNDACEGVNGNGQPVYYFASAVGGGYFSYSGPGALFYNIEAALAAGGLAAQGASAADSIMREYATPIYTQAGVYSFSLLQQGPPCDLDTGACGPWGIDVTAIPDGATTVGLAHDHPGTGFGAYSFSDSGTGNDIDTYIDGGYWGAVATQPPGRVLIFNPNAYRPYVNGQSNTPPICVWQGPLMGGGRCQ